MKKYAIIVGGGMGSRMGGSIPKQFMLINGKPIIWYSVKAFREAYEDIEIVLVLPREWQAQGNPIVQEFGSAAGIRICTGGETRFHSVKQGLSLVEEDSVIFVHDAVRCLLSTALIHRCYETARNTGSAIPVWESKDSVRLISEDGREHSAIARKRVRLVQTPQTFSSRILLPAYQAPYSERFTDEATVVEAMNISLSLVEGEERNIKITTPADLSLARQWMTGT